jgi:eukaryotic-like serine/threonine-protein kinase
VLTPGRRLGPYEVLGLLGAGGMGEVYRARDPRLGREVALKIVGASFRDDPESLARFREEARTLATLSHPNVVAIHDFGVSEGISFAVMELLEGETLRERLRRGPLPWRTATGIAIAVARGLAAAHARGVVHRDLKPDNVFLMREGGVKVLDFGLAFLRRDEEDEAPAAVGFPGTKLYMAPEQVCKQALDNRTDIFAFGVTVYEMLTGQRPFDRISLGETLRAILHDEPPTLETGRSTPPILARVIQRCLAKNPEDRYQDAFDVAFELSDVLATPSAPEVARFTIRQRLLWLGCGVLTGAAAALALQWLLR